MQTATFGVSMSNGWRGRRQAAKSRMRVIEARMQREREVIDKWDTDNRELDLPDPPAISSRREHVRRLENEWFALRETARKEAYEPNWRLIIALIFTFLVWFVAGVAYMHFRG